MLKDSIQMVNSWYRWCFVLKLHDALDFSKPGVPLSQSLSLKWFNRMVKKQETEIGKILFSWTFTSSTFFSIFIHHRKWKAGKNGIGSFPLSHSLSLSHTHIHTHTHTHFFLLLSKSTVSFGSLDKKIVKISSFKSDTFRRLLWDRSGNEHVMN